VAHVKFWCGVPVSKTGELKKIKVVVVVVIVVVVVVLTVR